MKRSYNFIFLLIWGLLFSAIPFVLLLTDNENDSKWFLLFFVAIGLVAIGFGIKNMVKMIKDNKTIKKGKDGIGTFITRKPYGSINDIPMFKVEFSFTNDDNQVCQVISGQIYTYEEVDTLKNNKEFPIKYLGDSAVIVSNSKAIKNDATTSQQTCPYCGNTYDGDQCSSCGYKK